MTSPQQAYRMQIKSGVVTADPAQQEAVARLDALWHALETGFVRRLLGKSPPARGIYIHGDVGRGKSMLMDIFYETLSERRKRRVHFHAFMQDVHERIFAWRQKEKAGRVKGGDPIPPVARDIAASARILCFDEFQVKDIADASILGRLFTQLLEAGVIVVATSNRHPDALYLGGLHRDRFLPFIALIKDQLDVVELDGARDYRLDRLAGHPVWFTPIGQAARGAMDERFHALTGGALAKPVHVELKGRKWIVPLAAQGVARLDFTAICTENRGAGDYLALAQKFHTVLVDNIPRLSPEKRNEAIRFVTFIDALYEHKVKLVASADGQPSMLYPEGDSAFEFQRTVSRLMEMQAQDYLALPHILSPN